MVRISMALYLHEGLIHHIKFSPQWSELIEITEWCDSQFGFENWDWNPDNDGDCIFSFREVEHYNWFILRCT